MNVEDMGFLPWEKAELRRFGWWGNPCGFKSRLRHQPSLLIANANPGFRSYGQQAIGEGCPP